MNTTMEYVAGIVLGIVILSVGHDLNRRLKNIEMQLDKLEGFVDNEQEEKILNAIR